MNRLYKIIYNKEQWKCEGSNSTGYKLVNMASSDECYIINDYVIGLEQIDDNSFLIHCRLTSNMYNILRLEFINGYFYITFENEFEKFQFLSDDTILFDNTMVYSISKNSEVFEFNWLKGKNLRIFTDKKNSRKLIQVSENVEFLGAPEYVQVYVDVENFKPITHASSTLRNNHQIVLSDSYTFNDLVTEDKKYANFIFWHNFGLSQKSFNEGAKLLWEELQNGTK